MNPKIIGYYSSALLRQEHPSDNSSACGSPSESVCRKVRGKDIASRSVDRDFDARSIISPAWSKDHINPLE